MLAVASQPAPTTLMVRYLASFQRFFTAVIDYSHKDDKPGILLGGCLADALHNIPTMLWNCDPHAMYNPTRMETWMQEFPHSLRRQGAPNRLLKDTKGILSPRNTPQELHLQADRRDVNLAPLPKMAEYLGLLENACLSMRLMSNFGSRPPTFWQGWERSWPHTADGAQAQATFNVVFASVLLPIPRALVQWQHFDEAQFRSAALCATDLLPSARRASWEQYFTDRSR